MRYKIQPKLTYVIEEIYTNDETKIFLNNKETEITDGTHKG